MFLTRGRLQPNIGYLKFHKNIPVDTSIYIKKKNNILSVTDKYENEIQYKIDPIIYIHSNIEFINKNDRLFENLFIDKDEKVIEVDFMDKEPYEKDFIKALDILKKYSPPFYNQLILSLKKIIFFRGNSYCFSTIKVHNCIFFNVNESVNDIYFLEHLLHEGGHIIFNNITFESKNDLFKYNHKTLFKDIKGFEKEHGDLYSRFHGIFTHYIISSNFYEFLKKGIYKDDQKIKELEGRFCFDMNKYKISLDLFSKNILSEKGYRLYYIFLSKFNEIQNNSSISIKTYDLSNQNYMFSFDKLCESNP